VGPHTSREKDVPPIAGNLAIWHIVHMDRDQIIAKLRERTPELKAAGVAPLFLYGSYARGTEISGSSDVDVNRLKLSGFKVR
jgi:hypothetical protein